MYVTAAGGLVEGVLLSQIAFWFRPNKTGKTKLRVDIDGRMWLAKTREELCAECGVTTDQYKRCVKVLKDRGLIETRLKKFYGKTVTHFWLDETRVLELGNPDGAIPASHKGEEAPSYLGKSLHSGVAENPPTYTETTQENTNENTLSSLCDGVNSTKEHSYAGLSNDLESNVKRWNCKLQSNWNMSKGLTNNERTMLGKIMKVAKENSPALIDAVMNDWTSFAAYAKKVMGWSFYPQVPVAKFLLDHVDLALQYYGFVQDYDELQTDIKKEMKPKFIQSMPDMVDPYG